MTHNSWIQLCKKIQKDRGCSYKEAMSIASKERKRKQRGGSIKETMVKELHDLIDKGKKDNRNE